MASSSRPTDSVRPQHITRIMAQTTIDAKLHADFEECGEEFDYSQSTAVRRVSSIGPSNGVTAYLKQIQKAKLLQSFGCMLAIDEKTFAVIAYSENAPDMLTSSPHVVPSVEKQASVGIGIDARTIFTPPGAAALEKSAALGDVNLLNPVLVHCKNSGKPFYAILHRVDMGLVIDFEPVKASHVPMNAAGALQSYKLAANAISRLQNMASGDIGKLCDMVVQEIHELTGYDRVMAYKFHDDDHGEVISEIRRADLEPYLGLHYPATDVPQASRFLFMKNKVRMICDCYANPVEVVEDKRLPRELILCGSSLRAPHGCHAEYMSNMGSIASLVIAVTINAKEEDVDTDAQQQQQKGRRLWGLVVCHHTSPRFVPFPLRYACEFLMQVFAIQLNKEVDLADQLREKHILRTQTLLCDMLLRDAPMGIIREKPNIMDLVRCDGAAFYYCKNIWLLGTTPSEDQLRDIVEWISEHHIDSTGLCTDSLAEAGYPGATMFADAVCGMAAVRINSEDLLFWFRSHTAREIKWGGAMHCASDRDDGKKMHPRNSFKAFIDVVQNRSLPWEDVEMDAIHSLQLILRGSFKNNNDNVTMATIQGRFNNLKMQGIDELYAVTNEMVRLIETATVPILAVDATGLVNGWNTKAATVTGLSMEDALGQPLIRLVEDNSVQTVERMLYLALQGQEEENVEIELKRHGSLEENGPVRLIVNACSSKDLNNSVLGVCFVAHDVTGEKIVMDKFTRIQGDYRAIVQNPSPLIPPMFGTDELGWCSEWNLAMEKLSGWTREEIIDKKLLGEVFGSHMSCCHLKGQKAITEFRIVLKSAITGQETEKFPFGFFSRHGKYVEALLSTHKKTDAEGRITGVFCFLHIASAELQQALHMQCVLEKEATKRLKALAYLRMEIKRPLSGITFTRRLLEATDLNEKQKQIVERSLHCEKQLLQILDDMDLASIEDGYMELDSVEFTLGALLDAIVSQVMIESQEKGLEIVHYLPKEICTIRLCGDQMRLQQILSNFLGLVIQFTPSNGWVAIKVYSSGPGIARKMVEQILNPTQEITKEGFGLEICGKLLKLMNGAVQYLPEEGTPTLIIIVELASGQNGES